MVTKIMTVVTGLLIVFGTIRIVEGDYLRAFIDIVVAALVAYTLKRETII